MANIWRGIAVMGALLGMAIVFGYFGAMKCVGDRGRRVCIKRESGDCAGYTYWSDPGDCPPDKICMLIDGHTITCGYPTCEPPKIRCPDGFSCGYPNNWEITDWEEYEAEGVGICCSRKTFEYTVTYKEPYSGFGWVSPLCLFGANVPGCISLGLGEKTETWIFCAETEADKELAIAQVEGELEDKGVDTTVSSAEEWGAELGRDIAEATAQAFAGLAEGIKTGLMNLFKTLLPIIITFLVILVMLPIISALA